MCLFTSPPASGQGHRCPTECTKLREMKSGRENGGQKARLTPVLGCEVPPGPHLMSNKNHSRCTRPVSQCGEGPCPQGRDLA